MSTDNKDFDFKINPCKACKIKCPNPEDVNCINNCCYETLGAFEGAWSLNQVRNLDDAKNCYDCVSQSIDCMGRDRCDLRLTAAPFFNQAPHYFPEIFQQTKNVEKAKKICYNYCLDCKYTNTCMQNCDTDSDAIESFDKNKSQSSAPNTNNVSNKRSYRETNPVSFYTGFIIGSVVFISIILLFIRTLLYGNKF